MTQTVTVTWHRIADTPPPIDRRILLCDARDPRMGSRSGMVDLQCARDALSEHA